MMVEKKGNILSSILVLEKCRKGRPLTNIATSRLEGTVHVSDCVTHRCTFLHNTVGRISNARAAKNFFGSS